MQATNETKAVAVANVANAKPTKAAAKPRNVKAAAKPSKPASSDAARNAERERCAANAAIVRPHYSGPSLATHRSRAPRLADALQRIASPIQCAKSATVRDDSGLLLCFKHSGADGTFNPCDATADLGMLSRIASLGFISTDGKTAKLTASGLSRAKLLAKRKA